MNLLLKRFSQDVDLSNPEQVNYFLVFEKEDGGEIRLPVQKETTESLVTLLYSKKEVQQHTQEKDPIPDPEEEVEEFSTEGIDIKGPDFEDEYPFTDHDDIPETEDDIPSV